jgi:hypothetical protein
MDATRNPDPSSVFPATSFDRLYVEADLGQAPGPCGNDWRVLIDLPIGIGNPCFSSIALTVANHPILDAMAGSDRPFRIRFDTIDDTANVGQGAYVDNIRLTNSFCVPCLGVAGPIGWCVPRIKSSGGTPRVGNASYALQVTGAPITLTGAALVLGISHSSWAGGSLPWSIPGTQGPFFGPCQLCVSPDVVLPATPTIGATVCEGTAVLPVPIPLLATLASAQVYAQWAIFDPIQTGGILTSEAGAVVIQP